MAVNPGNAGQMFMPYVGTKIEKLLSFHNEMKYDVYWDGACSLDKIQKFAPKGLKGFVLGTTLLFGQKENASYGEIIQKIRSSIHTET